MRRLALVCVLLGISSTACGQQALPSPAADTEENPRPAQITQPNDGSLLSRMPGVGRLLGVTTSPDEAATPGDTGSKLHHLLQAAAHLEAAGEIDQARRLHQQIENEKQLLLERMASLQAELDRLRQIAGCAPQIMVQVRMMELSRGKLRGLGLNGAKPGEGGLPGGVSPNRAPLDLNVVEAGNPLLRTLDAIRADKLAKVLAEPTMMTLSGRPASLHVGGQYPVLVPQSDGSRVMEYRDYGTQMDLLATALGGGKIRLEVRLRLSQLVAEHGIQIGEQTFPGVKGCNLDTGVEMQAGQTLVLGGLVQTGAANAKTDAQAEDRASTGTAADDKPKDTSDQTELLVLVTPRIVEPAASPSARLPSRRTTTK
jgi:Flp pilus assembly secretin CpaC